MNKEKNLEKINFVFIENEIEDAVDGKCFITIIVNGACS